MFKFGINLTRRLYVASFDDVTGGSDYHDFGMNCTSNFKKEAAMPQAVCKPVNAS